MGMETWLFPGLEWQETLLTLRMMSSSNVPDGVRTQEYAHETAFLQLSEGDNPQVAMVVCPSIKALSPISGCPLVILTILLLQK